MHASVPSDPVPPAPPEKAIPPYQPATIPPAIITRTNITVVAPPKPRPVVTNLPPTTLHAPEPQLAWVDLRQWSAETKKASVRQTSFGFYPSYRLESANGVLDFTIKNQIARWNGFFIKLSFAPISDHGKPFIQGLDLKNTVIPLLANSHYELKNKTVAIDPGHGGAKPGAKAISNNHYEKEYTLDWALRVQSLLAKEGWRVILTRTNDSDIELTNRVAIADDAHAALFISLHFNSLTNQSGLSTYPLKSGLSTYCLTPASMPSNLVRGSEDTLFLPNNGFDTENLYWAMRLHQQLVRTAHPIDDGVQRARFLAVLKTQKRPAVLIEGGYLSNRKESELISTPAYRQKLAEAVAKAILKQ